MTRLYPYLCKRNVAERSRYSDPEVIQSDPGGNKNRTYTKKRAADEQQARFGFYDEEWSVIRNSNLFRSGRT